MPAPKTIRLPGELGHGRLRGYFLPGTTYSATPTVSVVFGFPMNIPRSQRVRIVPTPDGVWVVANDSDDHALLEGIGIIGDIAAGDKCGDTVFFDGTWQVVTIAPEDAVKVWEDWVHRLQAATPALLQGKTPGEDDVT